MATIGEILRNERERKNLSIKDIEAATSIRALYINAIEEGNYSIMPGEVYLKGFIRNYGNYLGLDGTELVNMYKQANQSTKQEQVIENNDIKEDISKQDTPKNQDRGTKSNFNKAMVVGLVLICLLGVIWLFTRNPSGKQEAKLNNQSQVPQSQQVQEQPKAPAAPVTNKVVINAKFTEDCWISVTADGKNIYEGTTKAGASFTWEGQKNITLKAGNAGGVDIVYNGQPQGKLGGKGEVIVKTYEIKQ